MSRPHPVSRLAAAPFLAALLLLAPRLGAVADTLPSSIPDREFWALTERLSEPNGSFQSDNLLSNELSLSTVATALAARVKAGGVYLGVGPEQNFTYIAAMRPKIVFITDIRRGNLHLHLMYKALFELSADRAEFVSRLFTKPRPAGLTAQSTAADLMNAFWDVPTSDEPTYTRNLDAIYDVLSRKHGFPLDQADRDGIAYVYHAFYWYGPRIHYSSTTSAASAARPGTSYADLMMALDTASRTERSYLHSEESFAFLKALETQNLVVPLVGDFAGPKALRAVGQYVKDHGAIVSAFYVSNVESYLQRNGVWPAFCANVAAMPLDENSVFIRPGMGPMVVSYVVRSGTATINSSGAGTGTVTTFQPLNLPIAGAGPGRGSPFGAMATEVSGCVGK
jgi:hypothetical protein